VREVMVGGAFVLREGKIAGLDWPDLVRRAEASAARLTRENASARAVAGHLAPLVGHFCADLACGAGMRRKLPLRAEAASA
jgi:hypothetical protein